MSQPDQTATNVLFSGPTFHVSGVQIVGDGEEVSIYFTSTRHAFNANATQVRTVNEVVTRLIMSPNGAKRVAETLANFVNQQAKP